MININGTDVKILGNANEILYELMALKISIMQDEGLMAIDQEAMEQAIQVYKDHDYRFPEVRMFKVRGQDKTEDFKKSQTDGEKNDMYLCIYNISKECKGAYKDCVDCMLENIKAEIQNEYDKLKNYDDETLEIGERLGLKSALSIIDKHISGKEDLDNETDN